MSASLQDIEILTLRSERFREEREEEWKRLEAIVIHMEKGRLRKISDDDLLALPALYRSAASSLTLAREISLDQATLIWLESLVQRAWFMVYGPRETLGLWLVKFLGGNWSRAVRGIGWDILIAFIVMVAGALVGWLLVASDPSWYQMLVPSGLADSRVPGASHEFLESTLGGHEESDGLSVFAAYLFSNNAQVAIMAFALGFVFGLPTLMLLVYNTAGLGAMLWLFAQNGLGYPFIGWLAIHGSTELFAILLAGAAGLSVGRSLAFPGDKPLVVAAAQAGQRAALVMAGVIIMLILAALLEGFARQLIVTTEARLAIGIAMLAWWLWYFFGFARSPSPKSSEGSKLP